MRLKIKQQFVAGLVVICIVLNACSAIQNQAPTLQPSLILATSTTPPAISTLIITPTMTPTNWFIAMLTTTPTMYPLPTLPPDCGTAKLGNAGTQTQDNTQKILVQGTAVLCGQIYFSPVDTPKTISVPEAMIDLDTGKVDSAAADLEFCPGAGSMIFMDFVTRTTHT